MSCQIVYNPGTGNVTLTFLRGPLNFSPYFDGRVNDNLSTNGQVRERVVENLDILISFEMPHMQIQSDMTAWDAFEQFALAGGQFQFYPSGASPALPDYYDCVAEDKGWKPQRNAPQKYGAKVLLRVLQDGQAPSGPNVILRRFYGITP
jgi:hypothetical protein